MTEAERFVNTPFDELEDPESWDKATGPYFLDDEEVYVFTFLDGSAVLESGPSMDKRRIWTFQFTYKALSPEEYETLKPRLLKPLALGSP